MIVFVLWVFFEVFRRNEIPNNETNNHFIDDLGYLLTLFPINYLLSFLFNKFSFYNLINSNFMNYFIVRLNSQADQDYLYGMGVNSTKCQEAVVK